MLKTVIISLQDLFQETFTEESTFNLVDISRNQIKANQYDR